MNNEPNSIESTMRGVNRGLCARINELEGRLMFWRCFGIGMTAVCIILTALKCS